MAFEAVKNAAVNLLEPFLPCTGSIRPVPAWTTGYQPNAANRLYQLRHKIWSQAEQPFVRRWYGNTKLYFYPMEENSQCIFLGGFYEPNQMFYLDQILKPGMVFFDIGAHAGFFSLFAAQKVRRHGRIFALEPSEREFRKLQLNIALNGFKNIVPFRLAAFDKEALLTIKIGEAPKTGHNTAGQFAYTETSLLKTETVRGTSIDHFAKEHGINRLDIMKLDIEGAEHHVIYGAQNTIEKYHPILLLEIMDRSLNTLGSSGAELWALLKSWNYRFFTYNQTTGLPESIENYPGLPYTDFIAVPKKFAK